MNRLFAHLVHRPVGATFLAAAICVLGIISMQQLPVTLLPPVESPVITVRTERPGASARELEEQVLNRLEQILGTLPGLVAMEGRCNAGAVEVQLSLRADVDIDGAINRLRERLGSFRLPDGCRPLRVMRFDPTAEPVMRLQLRRLPGGADLTQLAQAARDELVPQLEGLPQVSAARLRGGVEPELRIEPDAAAMAAVGIDIKQLKTILQDAVRSDSVGRVDTSAGQQNVRLRGATLRPDDIAAIPLGRSAVLGDVATITLLDAEHQEQSLGVGPDGSVDDLLILEIFAQSDVGLVNGSTAIIAGLEQLAAPAGAQRWHFAGGELALVYDQSAPISRAIDEVYWAVLFGAILAGVVLIVFLGSVGPALIIFAAVPLSILATFLCMGRASVGINLMSLGGLALGIGMLVDNAIVVLEAATRAVREHHPRSRRRLGEIARAVGAVAPAVVASTLTTVAVFLPLAFLPGNLGGLIYDLAFTVSGSLLASLLVALGLVPPLLGLLLRRHAGQTDEPRRPHPVFHPLENLYASILSRLLRHPVLSLVLCVLICGIGWWTALRLPRRLLPPVTSRNFICEVELPRHFTVTDSAAWTTALLTDLHRQEPSLQVLALAGEDEQFASLLEQRQSNEVRLVLVRQDRATDMLGEAGWLQDIEERSRQRGAVSAAAWAPPLIDLGMGSQEALALAIQGADPEQLRVAALTWQMHLRRYGARGVRSSASAITDELLIVGDPQALLEAGIGWGQLRTTLENATASAAIEGFRPRYDGVVPSPTALTLRVEGVLREQGVNALMDLEVGTGAVSMKLAQVATLERRPGDGLIVHRDGHRVATLEATALPESVERTIARLHADAPLGQDMSLTDFGISGITRDHLLAMVGMLALSAFMVLVVMAVQFESLGQPLLVMVSIPLAAAGALPALLLTGQGFDVMSGIGLVVLTGIAVNNAIVLVSTANQRREEGLPLREALVAAGRSRLRPILMTTATTVLGLVPLVIGWGEAAELRVPLAIAVMGGLMVSTVLVLLVLPGLLVLFSRKFTP